LSQPEFPAWGCVVPFSSRSVEMRALAIRRRDGVHDQQLALVVPGLQFGEARMQTELAVKIEHAVRAAVSRERETAAQSLIVGIGIRRHGVQSIHRAALDRQHEARIGRGVRERKPGRQCPQHRKRTGQRQHMAAVQHHTTSAEIRD
jgi:hypothetical protein